MKLKTVTFMLLITMTVSLLQNIVAPVRQAAAEDITWTLVSSAADLHNIRSNPDGNYRLTQDIDLAGLASGAGWEPIGTNMNKFTGSLDGNGFTIRNMTINRPNDNNVGLFGITLNATVTHLRLANVLVVGHTYVGGIAGDFGDSSLFDSSVEGSVTGNKGVGVLVGYNDFSNLSDSYAKGQTITKPSSIESFGGLVGYSTGNSLNSITRTYSTVEVGTGSLSGGLIGKKEGAVPVTSSYWDKETSGQPTSNGGVGKTTAEMLRKETYQGWDFKGSGTADPTWGMIEGATYPHHYRDYEKVALASLTVTDINGVPQPLDRDFASDYGVYSAQVVSKTDQIIVSGTPINVGSAVSVEGGTATNTLALDPGINEFEIKVSSPLDPTSLNATYKLTVYRDAGTPAYPHRITTASQLSKIGDAAEGYGMADAYEVNADLDLSDFDAGAGWTPVGSQANPFQGTFNGNNHTVAKMTINRPVSDDTGLFGFTSGATVMNISLNEVSILGDQNVGGLIGQAPNTVVSGVSVTGAVYGTNGVGGLIGSADAQTTITESYAATAINAEDSEAGGLIGTGATSGSVTQSFWDNERSGQNSSSGGGAPKSTAEMMQKGTYTDYPGSMWQFGSGNRWGIIEGTTYPMPYVSYQGVSPASVTVTAPGTTVSTVPSSFDSAKGIYVTTFAAPVAQAKVMVTPAAGQLVSINHISGNDLDVDLDLGNQSVEIEVKGADGRTGIYRLTLSVPLPAAAVDQVPASGKYGIGDALDFIVAYDYPVDVNSSDAPKLPIEMDGGTGKAASYIGVYGGDPKKLQFRYSVQSGDKDVTGIGIGDALTASSPSAVTIIGSPVSLELASPLPDTSGILIDGVNPEIELMPSATVPVNGNVTITVNADGTGTGVNQLKWAAGARDISYFNGAGDVITGTTFSVNENGSYTVYALDEAGNEQVETIAITNIISEAPTVILDYHPKTAVRTGVDVTVAASVYSGAAGNMIESLKWSMGERTTVDFASPSFGTDVVGGMFQVTMNGAYTVYAADSAGNAKTETIDIANIVTGEPTISLVYSPMTPSNTGVDITVSASVYDNAAGNDIEKLKWAEGTLTETDFDSPTFGTEVPASNKFHVSANGTYTVYAADSAGNEKIEVIEISNIIVNTETTSGSPQDEVQDPTRFTLVPGKEYILKVPGLTLQIPAGAIEQATTITIRKVISDPSGLLQPGQLLISDIYELTKDVPGKFIIPVHLTLDLTSDRWDDNQKPALLYYDEETREWEELGGTVTNGTLTGETDHFTKFAVMPITIQPEVEPQIVLTDIAGHWAETLIRDGVDSGLMEGYPDGTFRPDQFVTRAELALMLHRVFAWAEGKGPFFQDRGDIPEWASGAVAAAVQASVISGYPDHTFRPNANINRMETAVMIAKAAGLQIQDAHQTPFADNFAITEWALPYIHAAYEADLIQGNEANRFQPIDFTTRAEAIVLLLRVVSYIHTEGLGTIVE
jgi:hypothetical protein